MGKRNKFDEEQGALFEVEPLALETRASAGASASAPVQVERREEIAGLWMGTSSFTASGWRGTFYPEGMKAAEFLTYYAGRFRTVEIDSTFYGTPRASTVLSWKDKTPAEFIFALKIPQVVTHEKILVGCEAEFDEFIEAASLLGEKLGPMLFQFPKFDKWMLRDAEELKERLDVFLKRVTNRSLRFAVELRNKGWPDAGFTEFLRERNVALALTDTSFMPRPWEMKEQFDLVTSDFAYVRWLGDRKWIEERTTTWDKTVVDRRADLGNWVGIVRRMVAERKLKHVFLFANNHYSGHGPATVELFRELWGEEQR